MRCEISLFRPEGGSAMVNEYYRELMHNEIDGRNSAARSEELRLYLASHPEDEEVFRELKMVESSLETFGNVEPPPNLKKRIMNMVPHGTYPAARPAFVHRLLPSRPALRYALVFAVGLLAGILVYALFPGGMRTANRIDPSELYGTILRDTRLEEYLVLDRKAVEAPEISGDISLVGGQGALIVDIRLQTSREADIRMHFGSDRMHFLGLRKVEGTLARVTTGDRAVKLTDSGTFRYLVAVSVPDGISGPIHVTISENGGFVVETYLSGHSPAGDGSDK